LNLDSIEVHEQTVLVHLHATPLIAACPCCGTAGSRVHSRYQRTIADVAFGGRSLTLKLLVRKWICPEASCSQHIFAERFPEVVQRYARMTDRLIKALQSTGVITNGADAAQIASSFSVPTTAKTIIRRVLQLPLPSEGSVHKVGIDEWAWKKGQCYGTILVDLEKRRIVQLLADRSAETSKVWLRKHPEIDLISRDRGKLFREAATDGAPQAKQVVDRFHLQKNFAEALEKFFRKQERVLKKALQRSTGKTRSAERTAVPEKVAQERHARHRQRVSTHKRIWKLYRQGCHKEQIAQLVGVSSRKVYRTLEQETPPPPRRRSRSSSIVDPYLSYLTARWNQGCHNVARLYEEIVAQGYTGTQRTLQMRLRPFRQQVAHPVSKQTVIWDKPPSPRGVALMMVRPTQSRTREQTA
jgi:transposase